MNKLLLGVIAVVLVIGAVALVNSQSKTTETPTQPSETNTNVQASPKAPSEETTKAQEAMMEKEAVSVMVTDAGFEPKSVTVKAGTKVVWKNQTNGGANVSSAIHPTHQVYPPLNLGNFQKGAEVSLVFDKAGTYRYHNHLTPSHTGTVVVTE